MLDTLLIRKIVEHKIIHLSIDFKGDDIPAYLWMDAGDIVSNYLHVLKSEVDKHKPKNE